MTEKTMDLTYPDGSVTRIVIDDADIITFLQANHTFVLSDIVYPEGEVTVLYDPNENTVPKSVQRRQAKLWLYNKGLLTVVENAINNIQDPVLRGAVFIEWTDAPEFIRTSPLIQMISTLLSMSEAELDAAFSEASLL